MDSNGYNKSLFNTHEGVCYYCHRSGDTVRHEVFYGTADRMISKKVGTWLYLCPRCHAWVHGKGHISKDTTLDDFLRKRAQELFEAAYSVDFTRTFRGGLKHWELEELCKEVDQRGRE